MKYVLLVIGVCSAHVCGAQQVNRCKNPANGELLFRAAPCPASAAEWRQLTSEVDVDAGVTLTRAQAEAKIEADRRAMRNRAARVSSGTAATGTTITLPNGAACETAKQHRQSVLNAVGINRTHDLLRSLDDAVYRACK